MPSQTFGEGMRSVTPIYMMDIHARTRSEVRGLRPLLTDRPVLGGWQREAGPGPGTFWRPLNYQWTVVSICSFDLVSPHQDQTCRMNGDLQGRGRLRSRWASVLFALLDAVKKYLAEAT